MHPTRLHLEIPPQPDDATCGPTCLHAVYAYYGDDIALAQVIDEVEPLERGGTLAVHLAQHALRRGYRATICTYNLQLFDPTWFTDPHVDLAQRLTAQAEAKSDPKLHTATQGYLRFLAGGGRVQSVELSPDLLMQNLRKERPMLTGLSATYLYGAARERGDTSLVRDDIGGVPTGHFVVISGYDPTTLQVRIADPLGDNPRYGSHYYDVTIYRLIGAMLLGVLTYDANFLIIEPARRDRNP